MSQRNPEIDAAIDEASKWGAVLHEVRRCGGGRYRIYFRTPAGRKSISCAASGSDINGPLHVRRKVRRLLGVAFGRRTVGARRGHGVQRYRQADILIPEPCAPVRPDPRDALLRHPLAAGVLSSALDRAIGRLLGAILRAAGHEPRSALLGATR